MLLANATCILGLVLVAQAPPLPVSELLAADRFNGQPVMVTGTMSNFRETHCVARALATPLTLATV